jgi:hypothetical protein
MASLDDAKAIQTRVAINPEVVAKYAAAYKGGVIIPDIDLFWEDPVYYAAAGLHRLAAMRLNGVTEFVCNVHFGGYDEALKFALASNEFRGLPLTAADKQKSVAMALAAFPDYTDGAIAELCGVSRKLVNESRAGGVTGYTPLTATRIGTDGEPHEVTLRKQTPAMPTVAPIIKDAIGNIVPTELVPLWLAGQKPPEKAKELKPMLAFFKELLADDSLAQFWKFIRPDECRLKLDDIIKRLQRGALFVVCPDCHQLTRASCVLCGGAGLINKSQWLTVAEETRARVINFVNEAKNATP